MALNLSTLTSPATSGNVLEEVNTTADFLSPVPVLRNLARGTNAGGDAEQSVALNQPKALPLIDGEGYLYQPDVTGNAPAIDIPSIAANEDFVFEMEVYLVDATNFHLVSGGNQNQRLAVYNGIFFFSPEFVALSSPLSTGASTLTVERSGTTATLKQDGVVKATITTGIAGNTYNWSHLSHNGQFSTAVGRINGYIKTATLSIEGTEELNVDFTASNVRHGDTKFKCATGQTVTINQSGNDPATIIKKPVLRFDGVNSSLQGLLANNINSGYMFAAFSVLGAGGEISGRVFSVHKTGGNDYSSTGFIFSAQSGTSGGIMTYNDVALLTHDNLFDDTNGDVLHQVKALSGNLSSKVNNADLQTSSNTISSVDSDNFNIGSQRFPNADNAAIDLEYLALFPASITDAQADDVRKYINNRNNVFLRHDTDGYYFFDAAATDDGQAFTGSGSWNGRIVGSDNGDTDFYINQNTANDLPTTDGYKVTFADNTDHFDIPSTTQAGWQVVGTSDGTFAYKVNNTAVTELNLFGNAGQSRRIGDLYGVILLPTSATGREIEQARKLLIDRGAADGANSINFYSAWNHRSDMVEFKNVDMSSVTNVGYAWASSALTSFSTPLPSVTYAAYAWQNCSSLTSFTSDLSSVTNARDAWRNCSLIESFNTDLPLVTSLKNAWQNCSSLTSFSSELPALTIASYAWNGCSSLTSFSSGLPSVTFAFAAWRNCTSLTDFSAEVFANWNPSSINSGVFNNTWDGCNLTAQSVENILTSIDSSGKHGTSDGTSGGLPLSDSGIDIDYDGSGLTSATTAAITSLKSKGWSIFINSVEQ